MGSGIYLDLCIILCLRKLSLVYDLPLFSPRVLLGSCSFWIPTWVISGRLSVASNSIHIPSLLFAHKNSIPFGPIKADIYKQICLPFSETNDKPYPFPHRFLPLRDFPQKKSSASKRKTLRGAKANEVPPTKAVPTAIDRPVARLRMTSWWFVNTRGRGR